MKLLTQFDTHLPRRVLFGRGRLDEVPAICIANGWRRPFVVTDYGVSQAGLVAPLIDALSKLEIFAGTFNAVPAEPELQVVDRLGELVRERRADCIIGVGGGSVMDASKVASILAVHGGNATDYCGIGKVPARGLPSILVPTTAGTGSEATFVAILTEPTQGIKVGVVSPHLLADVAVVDPTLTDNLPSGITAATGFDAIVHAMEALIAKVATPVARGLALQAASFLGPNLETVVLNGEDKQARDAMAIGSHLAGLAFANSSCCAVHALALPLGGRYPIPHGVITGCFFAEVMRYNLALDCCKEDAKLFADALGFESKNGFDFCDSLDALATRLGLFAQLRRVTVKASDLPQMAQAACSNQRLMGPNPVTLNENQSIEIYRKVLRIDECAA